VLTVPASSDSRIEWPLMVWASPAYSRTKVDQAGRTYIDPSATREERELALTVISNWRSSHSFPLNTLQMNLRNSAAKCDRDPTVAQRIKRLPSIRHKLERIPGMKLSRMQDIGGCRAVVSSVQSVEKLLDYYKSETRVKHRLIREDQYIEKPKASGYRGVHLVYRYFSDRNETWNGLAIEMQLRSRLQHAWATAVETVGTFTQQALKSSWGDEEWLRFFAFMGSALALREGTPVVPGTPTGDKLTKELRRYAKKLEIIDRLTAYGQAVRFTEEATDLPKGHTFLLELDISGKVLTYRSYQSPQIAAEEYSAIERAIEGQPGKDAVLVKVESIASLRRAYPNYFLDTRVFLESVRDAIT